MTPCPEPQWEDGLVEIVREFSHNQWVDFRENLKETIDFPMKYGFFLLFFPTKLINRTNQDSNQIIAFQRRAYALYKEKFEPGAMP